MNEVHDESNDKNQSRYSHEAEGSLKKSSMASRRELGSVVVPGFIVPDQLGQ